LWEFSSVEVLDKKATLSGSTLWSLSLMNKIAEQYDNRTIDQKQVEQKLDDLDKAQVRTMKQHDGRDTIQDGNMESSWAMYDLYTKHDEICLKIKMLLQS
jgi:hypothetical protein